jgi:hypothetical protein
MIDLARLIGSLVCRVLGPIANACFYPDGLSRARGTAPAYLSRTAWCGPL